MIPTNNRAKHTTNKTKLIALAIAASLPGNAACPGVIAEQIGGRE